MPASGLIALLDDIATIADDVATMAAVSARKGSAMAKDVGNLTAAATKKTSGIVTDDMAVTAEQAIGIRREREIPVVLSVAKGSFKNKGLILVPGALALNAVAPWAITPLLMAGGTFLAYEGVEKVLHKLMPHKAEEADGGGAEAEPLTPEAFEQSRIDGAIRTDLILSAEIIAISLGQVAAAPFVTQAATLYVVSIVMTVGVYGLVAVLIKLDDAGELLVRRGGSMVGLGNLMLKGAPKLLHAISIIGTVAMLLVGGQILLHGIHPLAVAVEHLLASIPSPLSGVVGMVIELAVGAVAGLLVVGALATGVPKRLWALIPKRRPASRG